MEFSGGRVDSLVRRLLSAGEMTETFEGRSDFLYYRHVVFDRRVQFPAEDADPDDPRIQVSPRQSSSFWNIFQLSPRV